MKTVYALALLAAAMNCVFSAALAQGPAPAEKIDLAVVREKIASLATPDETAPDAEQAINWLARRSKQIVPQLIAALDDKNPVVANQCLTLLRHVPASPQLTDALIAKAGDPTSPLQNHALWLLEKSATDPRVILVFDKASAQTEKFPDPLKRAKWSWLGGHPDRAAEILKPLLERDDSMGSTNLEPIRLLGEIGGPKSIELLTPIAAGDNWGNATAAYQALAKIDPAQHALTKDQATLLESVHGGKGGKGGTDKDFSRRMNDMAKLNTSELRPLVMQMLRSKGYDYGPEAALLILTAWKDKQALPQIGELMRGRRRIQEDAVAAYLSIDPSPQAQADVLDLLGPKPPTAQDRQAAADARRRGKSIPPPAPSRVDPDEVIRGIAMAEMPADRKTQMLRDAQAKVKKPFAVYWALRYDTVAAVDRGRRP